MMYGFIPYFEKSKWLGIKIEYDPYKYNSFTKNAGGQSWQLAQAIQSGLDELTNAHQLSEVPPILAFQSIVDSTVETGVLSPGCSIGLNLRATKWCFLVVQQGWEAWFAGGDCPNTLEGTFDRCETIGFTLRTEPALALTSSRGELTLPMWHASNHSAPHVLRQSRAAAMPSVTFRQVVGQEWKQTVRSAG